MDTNIKLSLEKKIKHLEKELTRYSNLFNDIKEVLVRVDTKGIVTFINNSWSEITGYKISETMGKPILSYVHPDDFEFNRQKFLSLIIGNLTCHKEVVRYITKNNETKWFEAYVNPILDDNGEVIGLCGKLIDITKRMLMEIELIKYQEHLEELVLNRTKELEDSNKKLSYLATHDSLTNIPNRYALENEISKSIEAMRDKQIPSALLFIDIDNFKVINDTYGHSIGDKVLITLIGKVKENLKPGNFIARLGGDEIALLLNDIEIERAMEVAEYIRSYVEKIDVKIGEDISITVTVSIGVAKVDGTLSPEQLLTYADTALYSAKNNGKNRVAVIENSEDKVKLSQFNRVVNLIKRAIKDNKFVLYYQPIMKIGGDILHYEALIRMYDENNNIVPPNVFIPIAEKFGFMSQIDKWVMTDVLATMEKKDINVFMNLSGVSLGDKALLTFIEDSIKNSSIDPAKLGFEITETSAISDLSKSEKWIRRIKQLGCKFALDDFGVGFSSFSYLGNLPIDYLKIDGSFVKNLDKDPAQKAIIHAMNAVAHSLGKKTIAEFVENETILTMLGELNVDYGQGYHIGKPEILN